MGLHQEQMIGTTVLGRPIEAVHFSAPSYVKKKPAAILFGAIHGDEPVTALILQRLSEELIERPLTIRFGAWSESVKAFVPFESLRVRASVTSPSQLTQSDPSLA